MPTARTSVGIRSVPRITPTAPPSTPMKNDSAVPLAQPKPGSRPRRDRPEREVDPAPEEHSCDEPVEQRLGDVVGEERARDRTGHRRERDPRDDPPVDPPLARMAQAPGSGGGSGDRDVRPGRGERAPRREHDERQPQRPEDETEHRAEVSRDERRREG